MLQVCFYYGVWVLCMCHAAFAWLNVDVNKYNSRSRALYIYDISLQIRSYVYGACISSILLTWLKTEQHINNKT